MVDQAYGFQVPGSEIRRYIMAVLVGQGFETAISRQRTYFSEQSIFFWTLSSFTGKNITYQDSNILIM